MASFMLACSSEVEIEFYGLGRILLYDLHNIGSQRQIRKTTLAPLSAT